MITSMIVALVAAGISTIAFVATMAVMSNIRRERKAHGGELEHRLHALARYCDALAIQGFEYPGTRALETMYPRCAKDDGEEEES